MPLYEYICKKCNHEFELIVSSSTVPECPKCQNQDLKKKFSVFATSSGESGGKREVSNPSCESVCSHAGMCPHKH